MAKASILLVEDEFLIRMALIDRLEDAGYEVIEAATAIDAWAALEERPDIAVIFTDIHMPGDTDGMAFSHELRHRMPAIGIIITSGQIAPEAHDLPKDSVFLGKPYRSEDVEAAIARLLTDEGMAAD